MFLQGKNFELEYQRNIHICDESKVNLIEILHIFEKDCELSVPNS
jgi:hypothetical protein